TRQFADYAEWQARLTNENLERLLFYWRWQLRGRLQALELPEDRPRAAVHMYRDGRERLRFGSELGRAIRGVGRQNEADVCATLLAGFKVLLHKYSQLEEIVVGTSDPCRTKEIENVVGPIANSLVLRSNFAGKPTYRTLLAQIGKTVREARKHREMPF